MSTLALRNYSLVLPSNYVSIEKDEMEYIDGGKYQTYKGWDAYRELSCMIANTFAWGGVSASLVKACLATASTGIGLIIAVACALGFAASFVITGYQACLTVAAAGYLVKDNGFKANSYSIWCFTIYTGVKEL